MVKRDKKLSLFFYSGIYNKLRIMIKQTWEISNDERNRILSLHESATKNFYILSEQNTKSDIESVSLTKRVEFPSGIHSSSAVNLNNLIDLTEIEDFLKKYPNNEIIIKLKSSESQVPNYDREVTPKKKLNPGDLSKMRYETIQTFMTNWMNGLVSKGIISQLPEFVSDQPIIDTTTPWNPSPGLTSSQISALAKDPKYTKHQFVEITVEVVSKETPGETTMTFDDEQVVTSRTPSAAKNQYNTSLFYNYSYAPAAVLGMSQSEAETLPGALLTMNRELNVQTPIKKLNLPPFKATIIPNGGQTVPVIILKQMSGNEVPTSPKSWSPWNAYVTDSYALEIPFPNDSKEFQSAWLFIYWYIKKGFPSDWNFISNKPENVNWRLVDRGFESGGKQIQNSSIETQKKIWSLYPMDWYAKMVQKVY
jgi:hypothetical protein